MPGPAVYVDLQLNGYRGVDFNADDLTGEACHTACERLRADGVAGVLLTIITDAVDRMAARLARVESLRRQDPLAAEVIWGVHVEGPFLNETPGYVGAHPADHCRPADPEVMQRLLDAGGGLVRLVTLAPERDPGLRVTRLLAARGVLVAAGHCEASLDQLRAAIDAGVSLFTHLGNGCPMLLHRHDNIIQRALSLAEHLWLCFIGDGVHVPYPALGNYLRAANPQRTIVVTDGISAAGLGPGRYRLATKTIEIGEDLVAWAADHSHFVGATATMPQIAARLESRLGLKPETVQQLLSVNPRRVLGAI
ncbi:MAG: N-acetylglucosamine-6-phosphate deacetylase [Thermoguttaceae bacterium]